jgi:hypothetical protein
MANTAYLASMALMGVLTVSVVAFVLNARPWRQYTPDAAYSSFGTPDSWFDGVVTGTGASTGVFIALVLVVLLFVIEIIPLVPAMLLLAVLAIVGSYVAVRQSGRSNALAVGVSVLVTGVLVVSGIAVLLLTG